MKINIYYSTKVSKQLLVTAIRNLASLHIIFYFQAIKRAENSEDSGPRRGTLVNALRIGDERDGQIVLCYNRKHFIISNILKYFQYSSVLPIYIKKIS